MKTKLKIIRIAAYLLVGCVSSLAHVTDIQFIALLVAMLVIENTTAKIGKL